MTDYPETRPQTILEQTGKRVIRLPVTFEGVYRASVVVVAPKTRRKREKNVMAMVYVRDGLEAASTFDNGRTRDVTITHVECQFLARAGDVVTFKAKGGWLDRVLLAWWRPHPPEGKVPLSWIRTL